MNVIDLHHVSFVVADTARALSFYRDVLGLTVDPTRPELSFPGVWLHMGRCALHLLEVPNPDPVGNRPAHGGRDRHMALLVDDLEHCRHALERLGIAYQLSGSERRALFCRDPDGNGIELIEAATLTARSC